MLRENQPLLVTNQFATRIERNTQEDLLRLITSKNYTPRTFYIEALKIIKQDTPVSIMDIEIYCTFLSRPTVKADLLQTDIWELYKYGASLASISYKFKMHVYELLETIISRQLQYPVESDLTPIRKPMRSVTTAFEIWAVFYYALERGYTNKEIGELLNRDRKDFVGRHLKNKDYRAGYNQIKRGHFDRFV